jgi:hypothetical protein
MNVNTKIEINPFYAGFNTFKVTFTDAAGKPYTKVSSTEIVFSNAAADITNEVSRQSKQFIENQLHWLTVIFLPKRSPHLNPVETRINRNLKKDICANHNYETEENLIKTLRRYLRCIGSWPKL